MSVITFKTGSIKKAIFLFFLPVLAGSFIQQMYSIVSLVLLGMFSRKESIAAIGSGDLIVTCLIGFFGGMSAGAGVITAQLYGEENKKKLNEMVQTVYLLGIISGLILTLVGLFLTPMILTWMNTPTEIMQIAVRYLRIYMFSMVFLILFHMLSGVIRATGNSRTPMLCQLAAGILHLLLCVLFIGVLKGGVVAAAAATTISQIAAAVLLIRYTCKINSGIKLKLLSKVFDWKLLLHIFQIGVPTGIQAVIITLSNIVIQSKINAFGVNTMTAFTAYFKIEMLLYLPILAVGQALTAFTGQNYGAGNYNRIRKGVWEILLISIAGVILTSLILRLGAVQLFGVFSKEKAVIVEGVKIVRITFPLYFLYVILECISSEFRGMGKAMIPMIVSIISFCLIRIPVLYLLLQICKDSRVIALTYPISWGVAVMLLLILRKINWGRSLKGGY